MLASLIAGVLPDPSEAAAQAGREWGRYLTEQPAPYQRIAIPAALAALTATLQELGFAPETEPAGTGFQLRLRQCPFREAAEGRREVVCSLHLGLMQGALEQMRAPLTAVRLEPFAEPGLCLASLEPEAPAEERPQA